MADFNLAASLYDQGFVESAIGKLQRQRVKLFLNDLLGNQPLRILEVNCGTGEDAIWLAKMGHQVMATDISDAMLAETQGKITEQGLLSMVDVKKVDLLDLKKADLNANFNLVFSNFGGINCIPPKGLSAFVHEASTLLSPSGKMALVIMPDYTAWDILYMLLKGKFKSIFRRSGQPPKLVEVHGINVKTWYYSPRKLKKILQPHFTILRIRPVGLFLPPSFLNTFFEKHSILLLILNKLESIFGTTPLFARFADHFYIECEKRK